MELTEENIIQEIANFWEVDSKEVDINTSFRNDLGMDSLDIVELELKLEKTFNVSIPIADSGTFGSVSDFVNRLPNY